MDIGESIVGASMRCIRECEVVVYSTFLRDRQGEIDVVAQERAMRPTRFELATFGLKDRRSLGPRRDPLTTELRAQERER